MPSTSFVPGLSFQKNIQQENSEAGTQSQVQTDGQQTSQSPPSSEPPSEENKIPDVKKVSDPLTLLKMLCYIMAFKMVTYFRKSKDLGVGTFHFHIFTIVKNNVCIL